MAALAFPLFTFDLLHLPGEDDNLTFAELMYLHSLMTHTRCVFREIVCDFHTIRNFLLEKKQLILFFLVFGTFYKLVPGFNLHSFN